jgi:ribosomal subunit interface protein
MKFTFTARHFKAHDSLKELAKGNAEKLSKLYDGIIGCEVILSYEKSVNSIKTAEIIVQANSHHTFKSTDTTDDFHTSVENAFEKIESQLKKYKDKSNPSSGVKEISKIKQGVNES